MAGSELCVGALAVQTRCESELHPCLVPVDFIVFSALACSQDVDAMGFS